MELVGDIWNGFIIRPMVNSLVILYQLFFGSFGLSIIVFTILVRAGMFPLTLKQSRQMKAMSAMQPKLQEIKKRYGDDRAKISQETMRAYKDHGVNPLGCLGPMIVQFPIFIGLFWALRRTLPSTPEKLAELSSKLYSSTAPGIRGSASGPQFSRHGLVKALYRAGTGRLGSSQFW